MCEMPKSISFTTPSDRIMMFSGLTSRCRMPTACAWASARQTWSMIIAPTSGNAIGRSVMNCLSVWPSMNSVTM